MTGTRAIAGSTAAISRKVFISRIESMRGSSIFTSTICAPASTWSVATRTASSRLPSRIRRANFFEPETFDLSPTLTKRLPGPISRASRPEREVRRRLSGARRGAIPERASDMAAICSGVEPQQPPAKFIPISRAKREKAVAKSSGLSS